MSNEVESAVDAMADNRLDPQPHHFQYQNHDYEAFDELRNMPSRH